MQVLILSRKPALYTTKRLVSAARALGQRAIVADPLTCGVACGPEGPAIVFGKGRRRWGGIDVVIPRIGSLAPEHSIALVRNLEDMGVPVTNGSEALGRSRDKFRTLQILARNGIATPATVLVRAKEQIGPALRKLGGPPVVVKLPQGAQGIGVMLAESEESLDALLDTIWSLGHAALLQEFVAESRGRDYRALVVGGNVVAAMRRIARPGDFRANLHRGGSALLVRLGREYERAAVRAAALLELGVAGVDLLEAKSGPKVIEVNSSPGFEGLERAARVDIARAIVEHALAVAESSWMGPQAAPGIAALVGDAGPSVY